MEKKNGFGFREKFVAASALIALIIFVLLRYYLPEQRWYLHCLVFLLVPLSPFITGLKKIRITYPVIVTALYLVLGFTINWWHPGWILFLTIPVFYIFFPYGFDRKKYIQEDKEEQKDYTDI